MHTLVDQMIPTGYVSYILSKGHSHSQDLLPSLDQDQGTRCPYDGGTSLKVGFLEQLIRYKGLSHLVFDIDLSVCSSLSLEEWAMVFCRNANCHHATQRMIFALKQSRCVVAVLANVYRSSPRPLAVYPALLRPACSSRSRHSRSGRLLRLLSPLA